MEFEDLRNVWQRQTMPAFAGKSNAEIKADVRARLMTLNKTVMARDFREIAVSIACLVIFGYWSWTASQPVSRIGAAIVGLGHLLIILKILWARYGGQKPYPQMKTRAFFICERSRIHSQIRLLESVHWWYLGPTLIGTNLYVFGLIGFHAISFGFLALSSILSVFLYRQNQRAVKLRLVPFRDQLDALLVELQDRD